MHTSSQKKVVFLVHHSDRVSGAEISLELLARFLNKEQFRVIVLLPQRNGQLGALLENSHVEILQVPFLRLKQTRNLFRLLSYLVNIIYCSIYVFLLIKKYRAALLHANTTHARLYIHLPCLLARVPCIWHIRDYVPAAVPIAALARNSAGIVCISAAIVPHALATFAKLKVIPNAVAIPPLPVSGGSSFRERYGLADDILLVAQVGQLIPWKNHFDLILTAACVVKIFTSIRFVVIGEDLFGEYADYKKQLLRMVHDRGLENYFLFTGYDKQAMQILAEIDILFHPTIREPFGRVLAEAMAVGKPVVAIRSGGPADIITDGVTGFLAAPHDISRLTSILLVLLQNKNLREAIGSRAKKHAEEHYTISRHINAIEKMYHQILSDEYYCERVAS